MKAKLFTFENTSKIELENGVVVNANPGTSVEDLKTQAILFVSEEYVDTLTIEEVDITRYKRRTTKDLQKVLPGKKGLEVELIQEIIDTRMKSQKGYNSFEDPTDEDYAGPADAPKTPEAPAEAPKAPKAKKDKPLKKQVSPEEIKASLDKAKANIGKKVSFTRSKTDSPEEGIISRVRLDKRSNSIQYRIKVASGKLLGKEINSTDLKFIK